MQYAITTHDNTDLNSTWTPFGPGDAYIPGTVVMPFLAVILDTKRRLRRAYVNQERWNKAVEHIAATDDADTPRYYLEVEGDLPTGWMYFEEDEDETTPPVVTPDGRHCTTIDQTTYQRRTAGGDWGQGFNVHPDDEENVLNHRAFLKSMGLTSPPTMVPMGQTLITAGLNAFHAKRHAADSLPKLLDSRNHLVQLIHEEQREDYIVSLTDTEMVADGRTLVLTGKGIPDLRLEPSAFNGLARMAHFPNLGFLKTQDAGAIAELWRSQLRQRNFDDKEMMLRTRLDTEGIRAGWAINNATYGVFDSDAVLDALVEAYGGDIRAAVTYDGQGMQWEIRQYGKVPPVVGEVYGHFMKGSTSDGGKLAGINFNGGFEQAVCWNLTTYDHVLDLVKTRHSGNHNDIYNRLVYRLREKDTRHLFDRFRVDVETAHKADAVEVLNKGVARKDEHSLISRRLALGASGTSVLKALLASDKKLGAWSKVGEDLEACAENEGVDLTGQITLFELNRTLNRMHSRERVPVARVAAYENKAGRVLSLASI
jgi:hypothetical protein